MAGMVGGVVKMQEVNGTGRVGQNAAIRVPPVKLHEAFLPWLEGKRQKAEEREGEKRGGGGG